MQSFFNDSYTPLAEAFNPNNRYALVIVGTLMMMLLLAQIASRFSDAAARQFVRNSMIVIVPLLLSFGMIAISWVYFLIA